MTTAIKFTNVSKKFRLNIHRARSFQEIFVSLWRRQKQAAQEIWVLKDVSLEIERGETVALVGPNGTGKSTSLKLISGILFPTAGEIQVNGRVGGLLELGAGFHVDLTGRENIFLQGAILGMKRAELQKRFDAIVDFSELEKYIDVPVKHYSTGMLMRLGFSIAIHTDPGILLVDEVLAVGDAHFQRKCLERIGHLKRQGMTILLVSHSVEVVRRVCKRSIWMQNGHIIADGPTEDVTSRYLEAVYERGTPQNPASSTDNQPEMPVRIERVRFLDGQDVERTHFDTGKPFIIEVQYHAMQREKRPVFGIAIHSSEGVLITGPNTQVAGVDIPAVQGRGRVRYMVKRLPFLEGTYYVSVAVQDGQNATMYDYHEQLYAFRIAHGNGEQYGLMTANGQWTVE